MNVRSIVAVDAILLVVIIILGIVLALSGRQYNVAIFTVHKLAALGVAVITVILSYRLIKTASFSGLYIIVITAAVVSVIALFISGAFLSAGHGAYGALKAVHIISSVLMTICEIRIMMLFLEKFR
jgi:hypothetical protein